MIIISLGQEHGMGLSREGELFLLTPPDSKSIVNMDHCQDMLKALLIYVELVVPVPIPALYIFPNMFL
jgi:hypothetical protein